MISPQRRLTDSDVLLRCLADCEIELDGEAVHVRASEQSNPNRDYRLEIASEICQALRDLQKGGQSVKTEKPTSTGNECYDLARNGISSLIRKANHYRHDCHELLFYIRKISNEWEGGAK